MGVFIFICHIRGLTTRSLGNFYEKKKGQGCGTVSATLEPRKRGRPRTRALQQEDLWEHRVK